MLASSFFDPVIGVDIHWEMVPTPVPTPTPIPNPFTGMIFDPLGLAAGLALSNAIGMALGGSFKGPVLYYGAIPATNTGTEAKHIPGHILIPPGTAWAPVPKTPKPKIRPNETPKPPKPVSPDNDAICVFGSKTVTVMGSNAVRLGDMLMSCSEPARLPSSVVLAVPKGRPIMVGGPPSLDITAALFASIRTRFMSDSLHSLISRLKPGRFRSLLSWVVCKLTGHPVDVATGRVITGFSDVNLKGPLPLRVIRNYCSSFSSRNSPLGFGWSLSIDQAVWRERGQVVFLNEDGRELVFDTFDFPNHDIYPGQHVYYPYEGLTLRCTGNNCWEIESKDGVIREFAPGNNQDNNRAVIQCIHSSCGFFTVTFQYNKEGKLISVCDASNRVLKIIWDNFGRIQKLKLPLPSGDGWYTHRQFIYNEEGDLDTIKDPFGKTWKFRYINHLLTQETDREGYSFYFAYDGLGEDSYCIRTWGDNGVFDHVLEYDKKGKVTFVTDSLGNTTKYGMNSIGLIKEITDPLGGVKRIEWNEFFHKLSEADQMGNKWQYKYDNKGNILQQDNPDGTYFTLGYDKNGNLDRVKHSGGSSWFGQYDNHHRLIKENKPSGVSIHRNYSGAYLISIQDSIEGETHFKFNERHFLDSANRNDGDSWKFRYDVHGNITQTHFNQSRKIFKKYDLDGCLINSRDSNGEEVKIFRDANRRIEGLQSGYVKANFKYTMFDNVSEMTIGKSRTVYDYNTEGKVTSVKAPNGATFQYQYNECGKVVSFKNLDGIERHFNLDSLGRIVDININGNKEVTYSYDEMGRITKAEGADGYFIEYSYNQHDELMEAKTVDCIVKLEYDKMGRLVKAWQNDQWVGYEYDKRGNVIAVDTSKGVQLQYELALNSQLRKIKYSDLTSRAWSCFFKDEIGNGSDLWQLPNDVKMKWSTDQQGRLINRNITVSNNPVFSEDLIWKNNQILKYIYRDKQEIELVNDNKQVTMKSLSDGVLDEIRYVDDMTNAFGGPKLQKREYAQSGCILSLDSIHCKYDYRGNLIKKSHLNGKEWLYTWSSTGYLKSVVSPEGEKTQFYYDAFSRRICKKTNDYKVEWLWNGDEIIHEWITFSNQISKKNIAQSECLSKDKTNFAPEDSNYYYNEECITWIFHPDMRIPIIRDNGSNSPISLISDYSGAIISGYGEGGDEKLSLDLNLWGACTSDKKSRQLCPFRFLGQYEDLETGLYYNRYRYYDPNLGIYISPDPDEILRVSSQYAYVANTLSMSDPYGLSVGQSGYAWIQNADGSTTPVGGGREYVYRSNLGAEGHFERQILRDVAANAGGEADALASPGSRLVIAGQGTNPDFSKGGNNAGIPRSMRPPAANCPTCRPALQQFANDFGAANNRIGDVIIEYRMENNQQPTRYRCAG